MTREGERNKAGGYPGLLPDDETTDKFRYPGQGTDTARLSIR